MIEVKFIKSSDTHALRHRILKPTRPFEECSFAEDDLESTFHVGVFENGELLTIATFIQDDFKELYAGSAYRLRGMATDSSAQGKGFGKQALLFGIQKLSEMKVEFLWCNARVNAFPFYESLDFKYHGPIFEIVNTGPHKVMYKFL
ncbi:acetyltransferase [Bdellovibrio bacteriovorus W]|nr:acetyltransferase [Bdellovibrio bacteriovorus W]